MATKYDVWMLEARLKQLAPRMNPRLVIHGDDKVMVKWGSNGQSVHMDELDDLLDLLDTDEPISPAQFRVDYWEPWVRRNVK